MSSQVILVAHNLRSSHNVGSLLRTAEGAGLQEVYLTGYTPYPIGPNDHRLPHEARKVARQIHKTALGAEEMLSWHHQEDINVVLSLLRQKGVKIVALEQDQRAEVLPKVQVPKRVAIIVGHEIDGIEREVLNSVDAIWAIPMAGIKESFNVVQAAAMAMYHCRFIG